MLIVSRSVCGRRSSHSLSTTVASRCDVLPRSCHPEYATIDTRATASSFFIPRTYSARSRAATLGRLAIAGQPIEVVDRRVRHAGLGADVIGVAAGGRREPA